MNAPTASRRRIPQWLGDLLLVALYLAIAIWFYGMLAGCQTVGKLIPPQPVLAQCEASCQQSCLAPDGGTGVHWDGLPNDPAAFDALADGVVNPLAAKLRTCETHRKACTQCLDRLEKQGVITQ